MFKNISLLYLVKDISTVNIIITNFNDNYLFYLHNILSAVTPNIWKLILNIQYIDLCFK